MEALNLSIRRGRTVMLRYESPLPDLNWGHPDVC